VPEALDEYLSLITLGSIGAFIATVALLRDRPPTPPTSSAAQAVKEAEAQTQREADGEPYEWFTFPATAWKLLNTPGFLAPLAAFVASIGVTNVVSAFTSETMHRAGFTRELVVDEIGAGFQVAIMVGGILLGGYVDKTKQFKAATLACFLVTISTLGMLGIAEGYDINMPQWVVVAGILTLGAAAGPVQPISAELAVEVSYPCDEAAVEATQQLCGNAFSALLVPLCVAASAFDFSVFPGIGPDEDIRGDTVVLMAMVAAVTLIFTTFKAELKRDSFDKLDADGSGGIDAGELKMALGCVDDDIACAEDALSMFERADTDGDGVISKAEYERFRKTESGEKGKRE